MCVVEDRLNLQTNWLNLRTNWWTQHNEVTEGCTGFMSVSLERDESDSTAMSVTIALAACGTSLPSFPLIRLLPKSGTEPCMGYGGSDDWSRVGVGVCTHSTRNIAQISRPVWLRCILYPPTTPKMQQMHQQVEVPDGLQTSCQVHTGKL